MKGKLTRALVIALAVVAVSALTVWATGTPSGTTITNTATLNYKDVNGNAKAQVTDSVTTTVTTKRGVNVSPDTTYSVGVTGDKITEYAFTITNTGNATDTIALSVAGLAGWTYEILFDADGDGVWDTGEETDVTNTGALLQDTTYKVIVRVTAPPTEDLNASDTVTLTATSQDGASAAQDTGVITYDLSSAVVDVAKVASTTTPVPLTNFTYTITVTNSDLQTAAYNVSVTDIIDTDLVWVSNSTATGSAAYNSGTRTVTWTIGSLAANTTSTLTITVYVGEEVPETTSITNTVNLSYQDNNGNTYTDSASSTPGSTQELANVNVATAYTTTNVDPGDTITIPFTIQNTGNGTDSFNLSYSDAAVNWTLADATTTPIVWTFYAWTDTDNDGVVDAGEVGTTPVTSTAALAMNATVKFVAIATVPTNAAYTASSTVTITATSTSNGTVSDSINVTNNVIAPLLTLDKAVDKASAQPGDILTYTLIITNTGDGLATGIVLVDAIPANTTYVPGSITLNGPTQSDADGDDYGDFNKTNAGAITVKPPNMAPTDTVTIEFKVTVN